jgi:non-heme chloroperoxidase
VKPRRAVVVGAGATGGAGLLYLLQRVAARRWRVGAEELAAAGLSLPPDLRHRFVTASDGGRIQVVERGEGTTFVLLHGITLGIASWAPQLRGLDGRVVAVSQRGHGQSRTGTAGYTFERLARDLAEVLVELDVRDAVLVGHSMGGMIAQFFALSCPDELARVRRLVLVATSAGPVVASPLAALVTVAGTAALSVAERRGRGPLPKSVSVWGSRLVFGADPSPADVELLRGMVDAMSPGALAALLPHLLTFDVRDRLGSITLPVHVVAGSRDLLTPPRTARAIAERVPVARLTVLPGCGHMVMLERAGTLCDLLAE